MLALRLGWRNLWRNPGRSLLSAAAIAAAFAVLLTLDALREGIARQMLQTATAAGLGHVEVRDRRYPHGRSLHDTLGRAAGTDVEALLRAAGEPRGVRAAAPRVAGFGLVSTGERSAGASLLGVDAAREPGVSRLLDAVAEGAGLAGAPPGAALLGVTLAAELGARPGDEVAVVTQAADGSLGNELLRVRGLVRTGIDPLDRSLVLLALPDLQALLALGPARIHGVVLRLGDPADAAGVAAALAASPALPAGAVAEPWERLAPDLADYLRLARGWQWVMIAIVGTFAAFGVANCFLMAVFERTREFGLLAALGVRPAVVLAMVLAESLCLAAVGLAAGLAAGGLGIGYLAWRGWDLSAWTAGITIAGVLIDPVLRAAPTLAGAPAAAGALAGITLLAALVPAIRAARLVPVQAMAAPVEPWASS